MITLTKENFAQEVLQSDKPVLVDFWATELAGQFRIMSIPTLMVFRGGQAAAVKVGVTPKEELLKLLG